MTQITKDEALKIAKNNITQLFQIKISDTWNEGWTINSGRNLDNCWYITFSPHLAPAITSHYLMVISKNTGEAIFSGPSSYEG